MQLQQRYQSLRKTEPGLRARDAATRLGVSEAELLAADLGPTTVRLADPFGPLLSRLGELGPVMALTRNDAAVIEKTGAYEDIRVGRHASLVLGPDIDLRIFLQHWAFGFASVVETRSGPRRSLQFFGADGAAVHKIYLPVDADTAAFDALVADFRHVDQDPGAVAVTPAWPAPARSGPTDVGAFLSEWHLLQDTHDFHGLLRRHDVTHQRALELGEGELTWRVDPAATEGLLLTAVEDQLPIMVFVGNAGCIEIHTGPIQKVRMLGEWLNILDPGFNLHLRQDLVAHAWVVRKPTVDGDVTSLELLDADGEILVRFYGERKPGKPELDRWRRLVRGLAEAGG